MTWLDCIALFAAGAGLFIACLVLLCRALWLESRERKAAEMERRIRGEE